MGDIDFDIVIPKYLTNDKQTALIEKLQEGIDNKGLFSNLVKNDTSILQGDGISGGLKIASADQSKFIDTKVMVLSNSCDNSEENKRMFSASIAFAPMLSLRKYKEALLNKNPRDSKSIDGHINAIKKQEVTQLMYIPAKSMEGAEGPNEEVIVRLDQISSCSSQLAPKVPEQRMFALSDYGFYLFLVKLSIHFCRLKEAIPRS